MTAGGYVLPKLLAQYMRKHPEVNLDLHIANTNEIADMLKKHRLDMALVEGPFDKKCFFYEPLLEDELVAVGAPGFAEKELSLADYLEKGKRLILRETGSGTRWHFDCFRQEHNLPPPRRRCILEISGFDAIKQLVRSGFGISVMSELAIQDELAAGTLSKARFMEGPIRRSINFIYMPKISSSSSGKRPDRAWKNGRNKSFQSQTQRFNPFIPFCLSGPFRLFCRLSFDKRVLL